VLGRTSEDAGAG